MTWQNDELHAILGCSTPELVFELLLEETKRLGLENAAWGIKLPIPDESKRFVLLNSYSDAWRARYAEANYLAIDPTVRHGFASTLPVLWSDVMQQVPSFWEDARGHGLNEGIAQSVWDCHGAGSMFSVSRDSVKFTNAELHDKIPKISWLAQVAHAAMVRLIVPKEAPASAADLTKREREILRMAAEGLPSVQIAERLRITHRTADYHIDNARKKLAAGNRAEAVFRAQSLGLLAS